MRVSTALLIVFLVVAFQTLLSQIQPPFAPQAQPQGAQTPVQQFYAEDGGTSEYLESIVIPPKSQAPFTLILDTEWVKSLSDGGTMTLVNKRKIARDSQGRIYQERWLLVPKRVKAPSRITKTQIGDPVKHILYNCFMDPRRVCTVGTYSASTTAIYKFQGPPTGPMPHDAGSAIHEDLGTRLVAGMETVGTRDTSIFNPGVLGNDQKMTIEREFWYSPRLGFNLLSRRSDPRTGLQTFTATELTTSELDSTVQPASRLQSNRRASNYPAGQLNVACWARAFRFPTTMNSAYHIVLCSSLGDLCVIA